MGPVLALFLALLPHASGAASSGYATIELRGSKSAHVDVRFGEATRIIWRSDEKASEAGVAPLVVRTRGTYAGYMVERLSDGKIVAGAVRVPVMDFDDVDGDQDSPLLVLVRHRSGPLAPGAYRIHLVTDGRSTVRFPVEGLDESASYQPKEPTPVTTSFEPAPVGPGEPVSHHRTPITVDEGTLVVLASLLFADRSQASYLEHCVVQVIEPCQSRRDHSAHVTINLQENEWSLTRLYSVYKPGHFEPGEWQAQFSAAAAGPVRRADTFLLTVDFAGEPSAADGRDGREPASDSDEGTDEGTEESPRPRRDEGRDQQERDLPDSSADGDTPSGGDGGAGDTSVDLARRGPLAFTGMAAGVYLALALTLLAAGALVIALDATRRRVRVPPERSIVELERSAPAASDPPQG